MPRSKNSVASKARRKKILKQTKGFFLSRKNVFTVAKNTLEKGLTYAYRDRKKKKIHFRQLWIQRINAAARINGMSYSEFMGAIHKKGIELNRKALADLAMNHPEAFRAVIEQIKN
ncbi:MAG: 50S ribosomal protein L20 [Bacteroidetes bacterium HGW-Bacteroidetes-21]|jgi:large subunit ribosomal protein L20|nr:MAG: 50S ribosomal protein L20 [Bacteroidetes bacterium HGW-Bacteroidetes-21]